MRHFVFQMQKYLNQGHTPYSFARHPFSSCPPSNYLQYSFKWTDRGITDPAPFEEVGGPTKINSIQNALLLRSNLDDAWDKHKLFIHHVCSHSESQQRGLVVVPFVLGYDDIAGKVPKPGHVRNRDLCLLDDLLSLGHFLQGVLKNMKGT
ncbi:hypothetical protein F5148DRAFT_594071 [Russula earlei]|uniref:Uncharacterized protein n=1 Tax=Russula earlei TaxID=71964 RepID=A0ACC0UGM2_9AGAM|nr:hypothetical protein F5148DRAFT_594071 [Russula earlei]